MRREWTALPAFDRETAILDALELLVEEPGYPRRTQILPNPREAVPAWRCSGLAAWGP